ncbi:unnamed protein product, partial [Amoebophrya sp. A120]
LALWTSLFCGHSNVMRFLRYHVHVFGNSPCRFLFASCLRVRKFSEGLLLVALAFFAVRFTGAAPPWSPSAGDHDVEKQTQRAEEDAVSVAEAYRASVDRVRRQHAGYRKVPQDLLHDMFRSAHER